MKNRFAKQAPDYLLIIIEKPDDWRAKNYFDVPKLGKVISMTPVSSYAEAHDDLKRCNQLALRHGLKRWAIIETADVQL